MEYYSSIMLLLLDRDKEYGLPALKQYVQVDAVNQITNVSVFAKYILSKQTKGIGSGRWFVIEYYSSIMLHLLEKKLGHKILLFISQSIIY